MDFIERGRYYTDTLVIESELTVVIETTQIVLTSSVAGSSIPSGYGRIVLFLFLKLLLFRVWIIFNDRVSLRGLVNLATDFNQER